MSRKLASVRKIAGLHPIKGADFIEMAVIDGWQVIVKKGEFEDGDLCVFFEIDSFLPVEPRYEFLGRSKEHQEKLGYRIKTMKMKKTLSQGLALPLKMFPEIGSSLFGNDVTEKLGVFKYDNSTSDRGKGSSQNVKKNRSFPQFLRKTDQERIQNLMSYFDTQREVYFEETLKLDGSSCSMYKYITEYTMFERIKNAFKLHFQKTHIKFGVASRNLELHRKIVKTAVFNNQGNPSEFVTSDFWKVATKYDIESKLPEGFAVQGELIGPRIQGNHEQVDDLEYYIFDVFNIKKQEYLLPEERVLFLEANDLLDRHVPIVNSKVQIFKECEGINELLDRVIGSSMNKGVVSEGRVYKALHTSRTFKAISNNFLLKYEQ